MKKQPRISYRDWLARGPDAPSDEAPSVPVEPVEPVYAETPAVAADVPVEAPAPVMETAGAPPDPEPEFAAADPTPGANPAAEEARDFLVFRVGRELFALLLDRVEEAIDVESVQRLPEMSETMLGVIAYRSGLVPLYGPSRPLGAVLDAAPRAALILAMPEGRSGLAVDDVDDVLTLGREAVRRSPVELGDGVLVGIARRGADLIGVLDADALVAAFRREPVLEIA